MLKKVSILILVCLIPVMAQASPGGGAINMTFNTSARAAGMGDTGVAVAWDSDTNHWANPALLAFRPGVHYLSFDSQLAVGLADDIFLTNEELTLGAYGITLLLAKGPVDGNFLDMGNQIGVDENGMVTDEFQSYMKSESIGLGVETVEILERILKKRSGIWSRYVAFAVGATWHDFEEVLAPSGSLHDGDGGAGEGTAMSMGYILRVTPVNMTSGAGVGQNGVLGLSVSGSYGSSILNKTDDYIQHFDVDQSDPFPRAYLSGWGVNFQLTLADDMRKNMNDSGFGILGDMVNPLFSITKSKQVIDPGFSWNAEEGNYVYGHDTSGLFEEKNEGYEIGVMNIFFIRSGQIVIDYGDIDGETEGGGWKIQAGKFGGFRKDWATVPQARGLAEVRRETWSVWVNPLEIIAAVSKN